MQLKIARIISILTLVPVVAFVLLTSLFIEQGFIFDYSLKWYVFSLVFLLLMPISAYKLRYIIPKYKDKGRDGERKLAFIMALTSYIVGTIICIILRAPTNLIIIFSSYLLSAVVLTFVNKVLKFKASGHTCGISGPMTLFIYFIGEKAWYAIILIPIVFWSRIKMRRHTIKELIAGTFVGIVSTVIVIFIYTM